MSDVRVRFAGITVVGLCMAAWIFSACVADNSSIISGSGGSGGSGAGAAVGGSSNQVGGGMQQGGFDPGPGPCEGLECDIPDCPNNEEGTTITGTAFAPNGQLPLYNVVAYIPRYPDQPLEPITVGAACEKCPSTISNAITTALSTSNGTFKLTNVPAGTNIPLVLQIGKWRRRMTLPSVNPCVENPIVDPNLSRLPRNQSEGDIPQMASSSGSCDNLPCLIRKLGLDASEFTDSTQPGRMHIYKGYTHNQQVDGGTTLTSHDALWNDTANLMKYDMVILNCECSRQASYKPTVAKERIRDYLNAGGRVLATHFHAEWFDHRTNPGPQEFLDLAQWPTSLSSSNPLSINNSFPKGIAFMEWLNLMGAASGNEISLPDASNGSSTAIGQPNNNLTTTWIYKPTPSLNARYISFNTPIYAAEEDQCGRGVYANLHVASGSASSIPSGCNQNPLSTSEHAWAFLYFDLAACILPDGELPVPPPPQ